MVIVLKRIAALFRKKKPSFAEALASAGFQPASTARISVGERSNREQLRRRG